MLQPFHSLLDQADIYTLVCSRVLDKIEETIFVKIVETWLQAWRDNRPKRFASYVIPLVTSSVYGFAIDDSYEKNRSFIGSEIDPLFETIRSFEQQATAPLTILPGEAFKIHDMFVPFTLIDRAFIKNGGITEQTLMLRPCTMDEWRIGKFIHPLKEDVFWLKAITDYINS